MQDLVCTQVVLHFGKGGVFDMMVHVHLTKAALPELSR